MVFIIHRLVLQYAGVRRRLVADHRVRDGGEERRALVDIQVAARMGEVHREVHIGYRSAATYRLALLERRGVDDALQIRNRETLISGDIGRIGSDGLKADIIQREVISDILRTLIVVDDAQNDVGTRYRRCDEGGHAVPATVFEVAQVDLASEVVPVCTAVITDLELQPRTVIHLVVRVDVRYPEGEQVAHARDHFQFRVLAAAAGDPCRLIRAVIDLRVEQSEVAAFVRFHCLELMPESIGVIGDRVAAGYIRVRGVVLYVVASPERIHTLQRVIPNNRFLECTVGDQVAFRRFRVVGRQEVIGDRLLLCRSGKRMIARAGSHRVFISCVGPHEIGGTLLVRRQRHIFCGETCQTQVSRCSGSGVHRRSSRRRIDGHGARAITTAAAQEFRIQRIGLGRRRIETFQFEGLRRLDVCVCNRHGVYARAPDL